MIKAQYAIMCEYQRPGLSGTRDLLGVFDRVFVNQLPAAHPHMTFTVSLYAETEDDLGKHEFVFQCTDPSGKPMLEQRGSFLLQPVAGSWLAAHALNFELNGFPIMQHGRYWFRFFVDAQEVAAHPLTAAPMQPPKT